MLLDRYKSQLLGVDLQARLAPAIDGIAAVETQCGVLLQAAGALAIPAIFSEQYRKGLDATLPFAPRFDD